MRCKHILKFLTLAAAAFQVWATPGDFDPAWTGTCRPPVKMLDTPSSVLISEEGKAYVIFPGIVQACLPDGTTDTAFAGYGFGVYYPPGGATAGVAALLDAAGRIVRPAVTLDPATSLHTGIGVIRIRADGYPDEAFGVYAGRHVALPASDISAIVARDSGGFVVAGNTAEPSGMPFVVAFDTAGSLDPTFGQGGRAPLSASAVPLDRIEAMGPLDDGSLVLTGAVRMPGARPHTAFAAVRLMPNGLLDRSFGDEGTMRIDVRPPFDSTGLALMEQSGGRLVAAVSVKGPESSRLLLVRLMHDGSLDRTFGRGGFASTELTGTTSVQMHELVEDYFVVVSTGGGHAFISSYLPNGAIDQPFGVGGRRELPKLGSGRVGSALQPDYKVVISSSLIVATVDRLLLRGRRMAVNFSSSRNPAPAGEPIQLMANGSAIGGSVTFLADGVPIAGCAPAPTLVWKGGYWSRCTYVPTSVGVYRITARMDEQYNVSGTSLPLLQVVSAPGTDAAVAFYHAAYDHYFVTTLPEEVQALDASAQLGWIRTGDVFSVWPAGSPEHAEVCRFWTNQTFAPKSSHFYTPYPSECASVSTRPDWTYEGVVMAFDLPTAQGTCQTGTKPLYRMFNNGQGGAPNHRYFTDSALRDEMAYRGWTAEGIGPDVVFACVPATQ